VAFRAQPKADFFSAPLNTRHTTEYLLDRHRSVVRLPVVPLVTYSVLFFRVTRWIKSLPADPFTVVAISPRAGSLPWMGAMVMTSPSLIKDPPEPACTKPEGFPTLQRRFHHVQQGRLVDCYLHVSVISFSGHLFKYPRPEK
jgi:hypothetical protein